MTDNDDFFDKRKTAAVLKHGVLSRYPTVFSTMTGKAAPGRRVVYLDGHAGRGRYDDGMPGSPLLALRTAETVSRWQRNVECIFVERKLSHFKALQQMLDTEAPPGVVVHPRRGDIEDHVDEALRLADSAPMLTFLDPFGVAVAFETLTGKLLARPRRVPTEVLLNLSVTSVWRVGGYLRNPEPNDRQRAALATLDNVFGGQWWRQVFIDVREDDDRSAAEAAAVVANHFCGVVRERTDFGSFQVPVRRRPKAHPVFLLVLFTRHAAGPWKFNDAVAAANVEWRAACRAEEPQPDLDDGGMFPVAELLEQARAERAAAEEAALEQQWMEELQSNLVTLATRSPFRPVDVLGDVYGQALGQAKWHHVLKAWDRAAATGLLVPRDKTAKEKAVVKLAPEVPV